MSAGMLSNPSALFLCMSYWADATGQTARGSGSATIVPPEFHCVWKLKALQIGLELWGTLEWFFFFFQKSLEISHDEHLNFDRWLCERRGWCRTVCSEQKCAVLVLHKRRGSSHVIKLLKRAWQHDLLQSAWKKNINTTDMEVRTARHLLCWWIAHYKVCFTTLQVTRLFRKEGSAGLWGNDAVHVGKKMLEMWIQCVEAWTISTLLSLHVS